MDTLDLRSSPSPMEGVVSSNDENVKLASSSAKYKRDKERYVVEDDDGEEEEDDDEDEDEELEDEEDDEYFEQSQDEESSESPSSKPSSSAACKSKSLTKNSDGPGPSSSIAFLKNPDHQWPPNAQPLKNQIDENKAHQIRLKNLRKQIDYIEQTNWLYTPIEELIGHTDSSNK